MEGVGWWPGNDGLRVVVDVVRLLDAQWCVVGVRCCGGCAMSPSYGLSVFRESISSDCELLIC